MTCPAPKSWPSLDEGLIVEPVEVSVIIPCYNGQRVLAASVTALVDYLSGQDHTWELIVVDDGSTDRTPAILAQLTTQFSNSNLRVIRHPKNRGKGCSVRDGMLAAGGRYRVFTDIDLDYPPAEISSILSRLYAGADVAVASRVADGSLLTLSPWHIQYMYTRHLMSRILNKIFRNFFVRGVTDSQAGLKGFTARATQEVFSRTTVDGFSFDIEALYIARRLGLSIEQIPVHFVYGRQPSTVEFGRAGLSLLHDMLSTRLNDVRGLYAIGPRPRPIRRKAKYLVVTADDYGLSDQVNHGIIQAVRRRQITSVSIMASKILTPWPKDLNSDVSFGLHVNLTEGPPATETKGLGSILDSNGNFVGLAGLTSHSIRGSLSVTHLRDEILAQVRIIQHAGFTLDHIDAHEHIHHLPSVRRAISQAANLLGIRWVRISHEPFSYQSSALSPTLKKVALAPFLPSARRFFRLKGLSCPDRFFSIALVCPRDFDSALAAAVQNAIPGVNEICLHPATDPPDQRDRLGPWRSRSLESLFRYDLRRSARKAGLIMTSFLNIDVDSNAGLSSPMENPE